MPPLSQTHPRTEREPEPSPETLGTLPLPLAPRPERRPTLTVVLPAYNEAESISKVCTELSAVLETLPVSWVLLFVNDGSVDDTLRALEAAHESDPRVGYLSLSRNFGHQAALKAGLDEADSEILVTMDADLQHPPELLPHLYAAWKTGYDVVHTRKTDTLDISPWRRAVTRLAYLAMSRISGTQVVPNASDFRLLDREAYTALRAFPETAPLYRGLTPWLGFRQCVLPYVAGRRVAGRSRYGLRQLAQLFTRAIFDFSDASLHVGLLLGAVTLILSLGYLAFILLWTTLGRSTPPGWTSSVAVTLVMNSMILTFLGIIGVYVARVYREVRRRPPYVIGRRRDPDFPRG